jgi:hypothetical protein
MRMPIVLPVIQCLVTVQFLWGLILPEVSLTKSFSGRNLREGEQLPMPLLLSLEA